MNSTHVLCFGHPLGAHPQSLCSSSDFLTCKWLGMDPVSQGSLFLRQIHGDETKNFGIRKGREQDQGIFLFFIIFYYLGFTCATLICQGVFDPGLDCCSSQTGSSISCRWVSAVSWWPLRPIKIPPLTNRRLPPSLSWSSSPLQQICEMSTNPPCMALI